jgi:fructokinase
MPKPILAFGEILWDLMPDGPRLGGAPFNFTFRANQLGNTCEIVSRIGTDDLGKKALAQIGSLGIPGALVQSDPERPTGTVKVTLDAKGSPDYVIVPDVAYDYIENSEALEQAAARAGCFCFGVLAQRWNVSRRTLYALLEKARRAVKLLDVNLRKDCFSEETVRASLEKADVLKLNRDELFDLAAMFGLPADGVAGTARALLRKFSLVVCVVTLDRTGAYAVSEEGEKAFSPGYEVEVVDSLGAGDAFTAGFIDAYLAGKPLKDACDAGNRLGAAVCARRGGTAPVSREDLEKLKYVSRVGDQILAGGGL